jgi:flagellar biosynthesis anti-sigma factor FlgM
MKVDANQAAVEYSGYLKQVRQQQEMPDQQVQPKAGITGGGDTVQLSDRAREVQQAAQTVKDSPDVREAMVEKTRMEVEKGTYKVVGAQVATDMLHESFENNLILQKVNTRV